MVASSKKEVLDSLKQQKVTEVFLGVENARPSIIILGKAEDKIILLGKIGMMDMQAMSFITKVLRSGVEPVPHEMTETAILYNLIADKLGISGGGFEAIFSKLDHTVRVPGAMTTTPVSVDSLMEPEVTKSKTL